MNAYAVLKVLLLKLSEKPSVSYLLEQADRFDNTPMHIAAKKGYRHIVQLFIDNNADVDCCNDEDLTPLHLASVSIIVEQITLIKSVL